MTPEEESLLKQALEEVGRKHAYLELEKAKREAIEEGRKEGRKEVKKEIAKKLKGHHTPEGISKITGLTVSTIKKL